MSFISYAQNFEDVMLKRALKDVDNGFYIDIGANHPKVDSITKSLYDEGWRGINIEPEYQLFQLLQEQRKEDINLNIAISSSLKEIDFFVSNIRGWSTTDKKYLEKLKEKNVLKETIKVPAKTLDEICYEYNVKYIHFLKIDVEGAEKDVIKSFSFEKVRPWIVLVEAIEANTKKDISSQWESLILKKDYIFAYFDGINKFYVAKEKQNLLKSFISPPNLFDNFVLPNFIELKNKLTYKENEILELKNKEEILKDQLYLMEQSVSWKLTKPLRILKKKLKNILNYFNNIPKNNFHKDLQYNIQIEGTYEKNYSLSLVNTSTALALEKYTSSNIKIAPTSYHEEYMSQCDDIDQSVQDLVDKKLDNIEIVIRNIYPPYTDNMSSNIRVFGPYGWEESKLPLEYVDSFNNSLTHVFAMSNYVKKVLIDNGVKIPVFVTGIVVNDLTKISSKRFSFELPQGYKLLHISSAFPRKGIDILLQVFDELSSIKNISLILKTFPNPHNKIIELISNFDFKKIKEFEENVTLYKKGTKSILLINKNITQEQIKYLYEKSNLLVMPTKGEGFGLPMAEAMTMNLPVLTTRFGGQSDFCTDETSWLCDFNFEYASTHLNIKDSVWQVPKINSLKQQIEQIYNTPINKIDNKTLKARKFILDNYSSEQISSNIMNTFEKKPIKKDINIALFSTFNTKCGIALYSKYLISSFQDKVKIFANNINSKEKTEDSCNIFRCWDERGLGNKISNLKKKLLEHNIKQFIIQYNFGFLSLDKLEKLILFCKAKNIEVYLFLHSTKDVIMPSYTDSLSSISKSLNLVNKIYIHTIEDMNYLKDFGIYKNLFLFTHGIDSSIVTERTKQKENIPTIATFGFLLPQKGIFELVDIVELLHTKGLKTKLILLNSIHSAAISKELQGKLIKKIANSPIKDFIYLNNNFLEEKEILEYLTNCDKIVYPYKITQESSSAAVRVGILSQNEVITTPSPIFNDVKGVVTQSTDDSIENIAKTIEESLNRNFDNTKQKEWIKQNSWSAISTKFYNTLLNT